MYPPSRGSSHVFISKCEMSAPYVTLVALLFTAVSCSCALFGTVCSEFSQDVVLGDELCAFSSRHRGNWFCGLVSDDVMFFLCESGAQNW